MSAACSAGTRHARSGRGAPSPLHARGRRGTRHGAVPACRAMRASVVRSSGLSPAVHREQGTMQWHGRRPSTRQNRRGAARTNLSFVIPEQQAGTTGKNNRQRDHAGAANTRIQKSCECLSMECDASNQCSHTICIQWVRIDIRCVPARNTGVSKGDSTNAGASQFRNRGMG